MLKKTLLIAATVLAAFAASAAVSAAPLDEKYTARPATEVGSIHDAIKVGQVAGGVQVTFEVRNCTTVAGVTSCAWGLGTRVIPDNTGAVWQNFLLNASASQFYRHDPAPEYMSARKAISIKCVGGQYTSFVYNAVTYNMPQENCALFQSIKAQSN